MCSAFIPAGLAEKEALSNHVHRRDTSQTPIPSTSPSHPHSGDGGGGGGGGYALVTGVSVGVLSVLCVVVLVTVVIVLMVRVRRGWRRWRNKASSTNSYEEVMTVSGSIGNSLTTYLLIAGKRSSKQHLDWRTPSSPPAHVSSPLPHVPSPLPHVPSPPPDPPVSSSLPCNSSPPHSLPFSWSLPLDSPLQLFHKYSDFTVLPPIPPPLHLPQKPHDYEEVANSGDSGDSGTSPGKEIGRVSDHLISVMSQSSILEQQGEISSIVSKHTPSLSSTTSQQSCGSRTSRDAQVLSQGSSQASRDGQPSSQDNFPSSRDSCPKSRSYNTENQVKKRPRHRVVPYRVSLILPSWEARDAGSWEARDAGSWEARDAGSWEARDAGSWEARDAGSLYYSSLAGRGKASSCNTLVGSDRYNHLQGVGGYGSLEEKGMYAILEPFVPPMRHRSQSWDAQVYSHLQH